MNYTKELFDILVYPVITILLALLLRLRIEKTAWYRRLRLKNLGEYYDTE